MEDSVSSSQTPAVDPPKSHTPHRVQEVHKADPPKEAAKPSGGRTMDKFEMSETPEDLDDKKGTSDSVVHFQGTNIKYDEDGNRVMTDKLAPGETLADFDDEKKNEELDKKLAAKEKREAKEDK